MFYVRMSTDYRFLKSHSVLHSYFAIWRQNAMYCCSSLRLQLRKLDINVRSTSRRPTLKNQKFGFAPNRVVLTSSTSFSQCMSVSRLLFVRRMRFCHDTENRCFTWHSSTMILPTNGISFTKNEVQKVLCMSNFYSMPLLNTTQLTVFVCNSRTTNHAKQAALLRYVIE
jgi:hypothetical protein